MILLFTDELAPATIFLHKCVCDMESFKHYYFSEKKRKHGNRLLAGEILFFSEDTSKVFNNINILGILLKTLEVSSEKKESHPPGACFRVSSFFFSEK